VPSQLQAHASPNAGGNINCEIRVESMSGHAALLTQLKTVLMKGSKAVATK